MGAGRLGSLVESMRHLPRIPLAFLGIAMYRAWFELVFTMPRSPMDGAGVISQDLLDLVMAVVLIGLGAFARRVAPLNARPLAWFGGTALLLLSTAAAYVGVFLSPALPAMRVIASVTGGVGLGAIILLWCERYALLAPARFCLSYSCAVVLSGAIIWAFRGFALPWQPWMLALLPLVSIVLLWRTYAVAPVPGEADAPRSWARFSFPWKPMLTVAFYSFAFGIQYKAAAVPGLHSSLGTIAVALVVVITLMFFRGRVEFESVYSAWLPCMATVFILLPTSGAFDEAWASLFNCAGYAASDIFLMVMTGALAWRYAVNPVWLYGMELGVRDLVLMGGRLAGEGLEAAGMSASLPAMLAVIAATLIVISEVKLDASWGIVLRLADERGEDGATCGGQSDTERKNTLGVRCMQLARDHGLTQREGEVLLLLAHQKTVPDIENELCIAKGTAKAHVSHVYQKLGVHSREELAALVGEEVGHGA